MRWADAAVAGHAWFSVTVRVNPAVTRAIGAIPEQAWTTIRYPRAIWDEQEQRWISEAQVAETSFVAFTSAPKKRQVTCRLVVRHSDRVGVLAEVLGAIRRHDINVGEMENVVFEGAGAACARIKLSARPSAELLGEIRARRDTIIHVDVVELK